MFSKCLEDLRRSTGFRLTFWYALVFIISWLVLFVAGITIVSTSVRSKDHQIVTEMLEKHRVIASNQGVSRLISSLKRNQLAHITGGFFVMVKAPDHSILYLSLPYEWRAVGPKNIWNNLPFSDNAWVTQATDKYLHTDDDIRDDELEILGRKLEDGTMLQVGYSAESREEFLEHFRDMYLYVMGPVVLLSIAIGAFLAQRFLRPIKDLSKAVESVQSGRIDTRVPIQGTDNELKVLAGQFNNMLSKIENLITGMREALDNVAHDLRTPLMRMRAAIESSVVSDDPEKLREALLDCAEESERIATMLTALMDISEAETGVMELHYSDFPLADLIGEVRELFIYSAEEKNLTMNLHAPIDITLYADYTRLRQVLCNLVDNAVKYTPENGWVHLHAKQKGEFMTLALQDSGIGISPEDTPHIFDRLYRGDKSRSKKGLGLGLSLVKAVVHAHKGEIEVKGLPDEGATFIVSIPNKAKISCLR